MANVAIQKVENMSAKPIPLFQELGKRFEEVRRIVFVRIFAQSPQMGDCSDVLCKSNKGITE